MCLKDIFERMSTYNKLHVQSSGSPHTQRHLPVFGYQRLRPQGPLSINHPITRSGGWMNHSFTHCDIAVSSYFLIFFMHSFGPSRFQILFKSTITTDVKISSHSITVEGVISHRGEVVARSDQWDPYSLGLGALTLDFITAPLEENSPAISHPKASEDSDHTSSSANDWGPLDWQRH